MLSWCPALGWWRGGGEQVSVTCMWWRETPSLGDGLGGQMKPRGMTWAARLSMSFTHGGDDNGQRSESVTCDPYRDTGKSSWILGSAAQEGGLNRKSNSC